MKKLKSTCRFYSCNKVVERGETDDNVGAYYCIDHKPSKIFEV